MPQPPEVSPNFNFESAFLGALIGAFVTVVFSYIKHRYDLKTKKDLIDTDLQHQMDELDKYEIEAKQMIIDFENAFAIGFKNKLQLAFEAFYPDVYDAMSKEDLFRIYKKRLPNIILIYKTIGFLKEKRPSTFASEYFELWNTHRISPLHLAHKEKHGLEDDFCGYQQGLWDNSVIGLKKNLESVGELRSLINTTLTYRFRW
ncbi:MAG: hypothetical protein HOP08_17425 [Cyclobacteriaceae bacterium]|nr:hypothetical protein [Cyclobacteriaceae bacterium]